MTERKHPRQTSFVRLGYASLIAAGLAFVQLIPTTNP